MVTESGVFVLIYLTFPGIQSWWYERGYYQPSLMYLFCFQVINQDAGLTVILSVAIALLQNTHPWWIANVNYPSPPMLPSPLYPLHINTIFILYRVSSITTPPPPTAPPFKLGVVKRAVLRVLDIVWGFNPIPQYRLLKVSWERTPLYYPSFLSF